MLEQIAARSLLTVQGSGFLWGFTHSLNPYMGCAFGKGGGCPFCYVRVLPVAAAGEGQAWGDWVKAKSNAPELARKEIQKLAARGVRARIFMSSSTDPYQGAEARLKITRGVLEALAENPAFEVLLLQTRSPMVERDVDLLLKMRDKVWVSLTLETDDDKVRRAITPTSPAVDRRLQTLETLHRAGLRVQAAIAPVLPCNPDRFAQLLEGRVTRVLVDTFFAGDGSCGVRSTRLGMGPLLERLGYPDWFTDTAHLGLMDALRSRFAEDQVVFSQSGFAAV
jgi:DNA repair photolyase